LAINILGISAFYHDSAACLLRDGEIVAAAQEERFTRKKHDAHFPTQAVEFCLKHGGVSVRDLKHVVFYDKPMVKFERLLETYLAYAPKGIRSYLMAMPVWMKEKLLLKQRYNGSSGCWIQRYRSLPFPHFSFQSTMNRMPLRRFSLRPSIVPQCCAWMVSENGQQLRPGLARDRH